MFKSIFSERLPLPFTYSTVLYQTTSVKKNVLNQDLPLFTINSYKNT